MLGTGDTVMDMTDTGLALTELTSRSEVPWYVASHIHGGMQFFKTIDWFLLGN